jgi:penicillin amidase
VIGAGEPALPGIAAGHNDRVAFGFTIVGMDQQDLYVERLDPADPDRYLFQGRSEPMQIERERLHVRGQADREVVLRFTRHGPVLHRDVARGRAYALRWVGTEPGAAGYLRSLALDTARNRDEFLRAVDGWKVPSENIVYADVDGNIGWVAAGLAPVRPGWNGLLPVPGHEGKYEWQGFIARADLPQLFNPSSGFIATANHNILPPAYDKALGYEFGSASRFTRILEVLEGARRDGRRLSVADFERLQHDELSIVRASSVPEGDAGRAARVLTAWDGVLGKDSGAAALFQIWLPRLTRAVNDVVASAPGSTAGRLTTDRFLALLHASGLLSAPVSSSAWVDGTPRPGAARTIPRPTGEVARAVAGALTGPALAEAWHEAVNQMGVDPHAWAWGRMHRARFEHPLAFTPARAEVMNLGEVARGGDGTTPNATGSGARQTAGASYREVIDVADWDRSTTINAPGLSGQPGSPHYGDLLPLWAAGRYHQMAFSRGAVEKAAASRLWLRPR